MNVAQVFQELGVNANNEGLLLLLNQTSSTSKNRKMELALYHLGYRNFFFVEKCFLKLPKNYFFKICKSRIEEIHFKYKNHFWLEGIHE